MTSSAFGTVKVNSMALIPPAKHAFEISIPCCAFSARTTATTPVSVNDLITSNFFIRHLIYPVYYFKSFIAT